MKRCFLLGLLLFTVSLCGMKRSSGESDQPSKRVKSTLIILTSDDKEFEVDREVVNQSITIKELLQDLEEADDVIPLPIISSETFQIILNAWESGQYAEAVQGLPVSDLIKLCNAASYLDSENLLEVSLRELIKRMSSQEEINEIFNDLNPYLISQLWVIHPARKWLLNQWIREYFLFNPRVLEGNLLLYHGSSHIGSWDENRFWEQVWDLNDNLNPLFQGIHQENILEFIITPDRKYIFSFQYDELVDEGNALLVASIFNQKNELEFSKVLDHQDFTKLLISPDKKYIVTYSVDRGTIKVWSVLDRFRQVGKTLYLDSMDGVQLGLYKNYLVAWQRKQNGMIYVWDMDAGVKHIAQLQDSNTEEAFFGFKDTYLFSFVENRNPEIKGWHIDNGFQAIQSDMSDVQNFNNIEFIENENYIVTGMFEPEQQPALFTVGKDKNIKKIANVNARWVSKSFIMESDDKKLFITASEDFKEALVFNLGKNTIHTDILNPIARITDVKDIFASLDGRYLVVDQEMQVSFFDLDVLDNIQYINAISKDGIEKEVAFENDNLFLFSPDRSSVRIYNLGEGYTFINSVDQNADQIQLFLLAYLEIENLNITDELRQKYNALSDEIKAFLPANFKDQFIVKDFLNFD